MPSEIESSKGGSRKPLCFVIGPIGKDGSGERKHSDLLLNAVIKHVLKRDDFQYEVRRADEDADPGMIGDRVVTDIVRADLVVADLTELNPNVFYELGIRHSTEKPTIHIARLGTLLPFDNVSHRTIFVDLTDWHSIELARDRLAESARAITAPEFRVSNPITQANASFKMRQSEDPRDNLVADVQERLATLESRLSSSSIQKGSSLDEEHELFKRYQLFINSLLGTGINKTSIDRRVRHQGMMEGNSVEVIGINDEYVEVNINGMVHRWRR
jgi:hypothetical protein